MRLTTCTNLATRILMFCGVNTGRIKTKGEIARACNARENHIVQVVNMLAQKGYLTTTRGRGGGTKLASAPGDINVGQVICTYEPSSSLSIP